MKWLDMPPAWLVLMIGLADAQAVCCLWVRALRAGRLCRAGG